MKKSPREFTEIKVPVIPHWCAYFNENHSISYVVVFVVLQTSLWDKKKICKVLLLNTCPSLFVIPLTVVDEMSMSDIKSTNPSCCRPCAYLVSICPPSSVAKLLTSQGLGIGEGVAVIPAAPLCVPAGISPSSAEQWTQLTGSAVGAGGAFFFKPHFLTSCSTDQTFLENTE